MIEKSFNNDISNPESELTTTISRRYKLLKGVSGQLDEDIMLLKKYIESYNWKVKLVKRLLSSMKSEDFDKLLKMISGQLKDIVTKEVDEETQQESYALNALATISKLLSEEKKEEYKADEEALFENLKALENDIKDLRPYILKQAEFLKLPREEQKKRIKELIECIKDEGYVVGAVEVDAKELEKALIEIGKEEIIEEIEAE